MKQLLYLTIGNTVLKTKEAHAKEILNIANRFGIKLLSLIAKRDEIYIKIYSKDESRFVENLKNKGVEINIVARRGIIHTVKKYRYRFGMIFGIIMFLAVLFLSPMFIWEINITGTEKLSTDYIQSLLKKEGVFLGAFSPSVDRKALYRNILCTSTDISWISVNFIGSSANVEVLERDYSQASKVIYDGANIIAKKDGKIIEADVISGKLMTKSNSVVKKGDILVSGVYESAKLGTRYVYSNASVYAQVFDEYTIEIPLNNAKKLYSDESVAECNIKMFGKSINIFKNYSILDENYDTIYKDINFPISKFDKLPLSIEKTCVIPYIYETVTLSIDEALNRARTEFFTLLDTSADYIELLSIEENFNVENSVLILKCTVEAVENIAVTNEFDIQ